MQRHKKRRELVDEIPWPQLSIFIQPGRWGSNDEQKELGRERGACKQDTHNMLKWS